MKTSFKSHIFFEKKQFKNIQLSCVNLKQRIKFILSLICNSSTELSIRFCDESEMLAANTSFRKKKYPTDVLSFPNLCSPHNGEPIYMGDILICIPVCIVQAKKAKHTLCEELEKMIIHGIVHLKGLDHERDLSSFRVMSSFEFSLQKELIVKFKKPIWCFMV